VGSSPTRVIAAVLTHAPNAEDQAVSPPASVAREWEELLPGSARELLDMHEQEQAHRQSLDRKIVGEIVASSRWGRFVGTGVVVVFLGAGFVLVWTGHEAGGYGSLANRSDVAARHVLKPAPPACRYAVSLGFRPAEGAVTPRLSRVKSRVVV
jgi:uncharacterized membrane protein